MVKVKSLGLRVSDFNVWDLGLFAVGRDKIMKTTAWFGSFCEERDVQNNTKHL